MSDISTQVRASGRNVTVFGIITIILGMAAIAAPAITGLSVVLTVGLLVIVGGILRMFWAFGAGSFGKGVLAFAIGGLTFLCGVALATDPLIASGFLTIILAVFLIADGVAEIVGAFSLSPESGRGWLLVGGIVSIILGTMIWRQFPLSGVWAIGVILGIRLLSMGMVMVGGGSAMRTLAKDASGSA